MRNQLVYILNVLPILLSQSDCDFLLAKSCCDAELVDFYETAHLYDYPFGLVRKFVLWKSAMVNACCQLVMLGLDCRFTRGHFYAALLNGACPGEVHNARLVVARPHLKTFGMKLFALLSIFPLVAGQQMDCLWLQDCCTNEALSYLKTNHADNILWFLIPILNQPVIIAELKNRNLCKTNIQATTTPCVSNARSTCGWLQKPFTHSSFQYYGECCTKRGIVYMDTLYSFYNWNLFNDKGQMTQIVTMMRTNGMCPKPITDVINDLECYWLADEIVHDDFECDSCSPPGCHAQIRRCYQKSENGLCPNILSKEECSWLDQSFNTTFGFVYSGECCSRAALNSVTSYPDWEIASTEDRVVMIKNAMMKGLCDEVTTPKPTTKKPTVKPTVTPTEEQTEKPTVTPIVKQTVKLTEKPTATPTEEQTVKPTVKLIVKPTVEQPSSTSKRTSSKPISTDFTATQVNTDKSSSTIPEISGATTKRSETNKPKTPAPEKDPPATTKRVEGSTDSTITSDPPSDGTTTNDTESTTSETTDSTSDASTVTIRPNTTKTFGTKKSTMTVKLIEGKSSTKPATEATERRTTSTDDRTTDDSNDVKIVPKTTPKATTGTPAARIGSSDSTVSTSESLANSTMDNGAPTTRETTTTDGGVNTKTITISRESNETVMTSRGDGGRMTTSDGEKSTTSDGKKSTEGGRSTPATRTRMESASASSSSSTSPTPKETPTPSDAPKETPTPVPKETPKETATSTSNETPKETLTPTNATKETSTPTPKATLTPTPKVTPTPTDAPTTTTQFFPESLTTKIYIPTGEIIISEVVKSLENCTAIVYQRLLNRTDNSTRIIRFTINTCTSSTSPPPTTTSTSEAPTTMYFPESMTTKIYIPTGEIIISEVIQAFDNCTTILHQKLLNRTTGTTRVISSEPDVRGCETTTKAPDEPTTTTMYFPESATTKIYERTGEIIISEVIKAFDNCTTVLYQKLWNRGNDTTRVIETTDQYGCMKTSTTRDPSTTTTMFFPESATTQIYKPTGEIIISEVIKAFDNCTTVLYQKLLNRATGTTRVITQSDPKGCMKMTTKKEEAATTTMYFPESATTKIYIPTGEIIVSEVVKAFENCTMVLYQKLWNRETDTTRVIETSTNDGCQTSTTAAPDDSATTTMYFPESATTKIYIPTGEIIVSEIIKAFENCTTVLYQKLWNRETGATRVISEADNDGCRKTEAPSASPTTTMDFPESATTKVYIPTGEIIVSEVIKAFENCTTVLYQKLWNRATGATRVISTSDPQGCKQTTTQRPDASTTTTMDWPQGTTRILPNGEIIVSEIIKAYENCTTVLFQKIWNRKTDETRVESVTDAEGCKKISTTPSPDGGIEWPDVGTTRTLPTGEIILSEVIKTFENCTTVLYQKIWNRETNETRVDVTADPEGCKHTSQKPTTVTTTSDPIPEFPNSGTTKTLPNDDDILSEASSTTATTTPTPPPIDFPTGGTTKTLPNGEILISENVVSYENCSTVLYQLILDPVTNKTETKTTTDPEGCKATTTTLKPAIANKTCSTLSIDLSYTLLPKPASLKKSYEPGDKCDEKILRTDMSLSMQSLAISTYKEALNVKKNYADVATEIRNVFDQKYGKYWQCIVGVNYAYDIWYENHSFIYYQVDNVLILLYKARKTE
ncbi:unnamed protein product [Caenorhabditis bovis]|uniref:Uncharacterized protein n=1 Tax=Caenorhabditis bovis TaxID=2654633 RepID=A0A8S1FAX9_9PELO|nr:unnamed protein product [Caenorhabditis bovis]